MGPGPATLMLPLVPGLGQERSKAGSHPEGRNVAAHPLNPSLLAPPATPPMLPVTVSPPNKDCIFYSDVQRQRLPLKLSPSIINESGVRWGKQVADNTKVGGQLCTFHGSDHTAAAECARVCVLTASSSNATAGRLLASFTLERRGPWAWLSPVSTPFLKGRENLTAWLPFAARCVSCFWTTRHYYSQHEQDENQHLNICICLSGFLCETGMWKLSNFF